MRSAIIEKIDRELRVPIDSERQVVYLLVEIRKLIEINGDGPSYRSLRFACDWVVHAKLTGPEARNIVEQVDRFQQQVEAISNLKSGTKVDSTCLLQVGEILKLSRLKAELKKYLKNQGLDSTIADDHAKWANFLRYYAAVVEDCPLKCVAANLTCTDEVVLKVVDAMADQAEQGANGYSLTIEWRWTSKVNGEETVYELRC